ncbi:MAG: polyphosphate kinase 1 [Methylococcales bacterium]|jgi:polyphosphate kinase|nr:polyphosphate kinase 1 [Methylococcales bacterium]MBT7408144.1 polyphosphate kinase 1 [Methylococcales bacterium]
MPKESPDDFPVIPKELSWLSFNQRVLQEAEDPSVPIIQRIRYLGIFSNNSDEFFRVRVADVKRLILFSGAKQSEYSKQLLEKITRNVLKQRKTFEKTLSSILTELRRRHIYLVNERQLTDKQGLYVKQYFHEKILPELSLVFLDDKSPLPHLKEGSIYLAIQACHNDAQRYAILEIPTNRLDRFILIPPKNRKHNKVLIVLDNVIRYCLEDVFIGSIPIDEVHAFTIKITRDAELELGETITKSLLDKMTTSLKKRSFGIPVRMIYDSNMPQKMLDFMTKKLGFKHSDNLIPGGRYHNSKDFMSFPNLGPSYLELKELPLIPVPELETTGNIFNCISHQDCLLYYPYNSFSYIIKLLRTAAIDPTVRSIKINLYRVASKSKVIESLINAVRNGKEVTTVVELQARFDEQANIGWAQRLTEAGVQVIFGIPGLKVHSKLIVIKRQEGNTYKYYSHIGTGNFHEKTARIYTDFSLLTYDQEIGKEVEKVFDFIKYTHHRHTFKKLLVSPYDNRTSITALIDNEINYASKRKTARITIKCNNLVDKTIVDKLYEASQAGVSIRLIIRGMCSIVPSIPGISDNIEAISIVDRYLEHARVYIFHNKNKPKYYISSADLMTRNMDHRVEVSCPISDPKLQEKIQKILDYQWNDRVKARVLNDKQDNQLKPRGNRRKIRSQHQIHRFMCLSAKESMKNNIDPET